MIPSEYAVFEGMSSTPLMILPLASEKLGRWRFLREPVGLFAAMDSPFSEGDLWSGRVAGDTVARPLSTYSPWLDSLQSKNSEISAKVLYLTRRDNYLGVLLKTKVKVPFDRAVDRTVEALFPSFLPAESVSFCWSFQPCNPLPTHHSAVGRQHSMIRFGQLLAVVFKDLLCSHPEAPPKYRAFS